MCIYNLHTHTKYRIKFFTTYIRGTSFFLTLRLYKRISGILLPKMTEPGSGLICMEVLGVMFSMPLKHIAYSNNALLDIHVIVVLHL